MTVKDLKNKIKNLPDDIPIVLVNGVGRGSIATSDELYTGILFTYEEEVSIPQYSTRREESFVRPERALILHADF